MYVAHMWLHEILYKLFGFFQTYSAFIGFLEAKLVKIEIEMNTEQNLEQTLIESLKQAELVKTLDQLQKPE